MKKKMFVIMVLWLLLGQVSFSQVALGLFAGPNRTHFWGSELAGNVLPGYSYAGGITVEFFVKKQFSVIAEPHYEVKGNRVLIDLTDHTGRKIGEAKIKNKLSYLSLPVMCRIRFGKNVKFFLNGGPYVAYLLPAPVTRGANPAFMVPNNYEYFNKMDFGAALGSGIEIPLTQRSALTLHLKDELGLSHISRFYYPGQPLRNNATSFLIGFWWLPGKEAGK